MSENSNIEWTDHTWSPWDGCTKVSLGCKYCYAEARDKRHLIEDVDHWGKGAPRRLRKDWNSPIKWNKEAVCVKCGKAWPARGMHPDCDGENRDFRRQRVFPSLCDWLDEEVPTLWLGRFLGLVNSTPNLTWQLLTKRPELFESRMKAVAGEEMPWAILARRWLDGNAPSNVWVGTSVEDQEWAAKRVPALLQIQAQLRFLSVEPLLGRVDLAMINDGSWWDKEGADKYDALRGFAYWGSHGDYAHGLSGGPKLDWVIVGGESGTNARPCYVENIAEVQNQCRRAGVKCFVKQFGSNAFCIREPERPWRGLTRLSNTLRHPKGGDPSEWPEEFRVREVPSDL